MKVFAVAVIATLAQTGVEAAQGQVLLRGYQLCVKHTNDKGGVLGRRLELVLYDDGSDNEPANWSTERVRREQA